MSKTIFLSTVTNEFLAVRRRLAALGTRTKRLHVRHQDDFVHQGLLTLQMLEEEVGKSELVVHVIGSRAGAVPPLDQVEELLSRYPDFAVRFPDVVAAARKGEVSYTQWEAWLALYFSGSGKPLRLCRYELIDSRTGRDPSQTAHVDRLKQRKVYPKEVASENELVDEVVLTLIELGYLTHEEGRHVIHLPYQSLGTLFKGRDDFLHQLRESLTKSSSQATAITGKTVHGLGGVGKTRLAVEYAWQHADEYSAVLFVTADSPAGLKQNLAELVGPLVLNLPEQEATEEPVRVGAALRWLQEHPGWFLILDNVDTEEAAEHVEDLLTHLQGGQVLITSRLANWGSHVEPLELDVLPEAAATSFLLERTAPRPGGRGRRATTTDDADAAQLARELDRLALALEQAGAYIAARRISLAEYRQLWMSHEPAVQDWHHPREMKYPRSVAVTWQTTLDQLGSHEVALMNLLAWLAPEPVSLGWFESARASEIWAEGVARLDSRAMKDDAETNVVADAASVGSDAGSIRHGRPTLRDAVAALADFSMLRWDASAATVTVHRVVQEILRTRQTEPTAWLTGTLQLLNAARPEGNPSDVRTWRAWEPLRPHVAFTTAEGERLNIANPTSELMGELATFLKGKALYTAGEQLERSALMIDERAHGPDSPQMSLRLNNLAQALQATNRLAEAEPLMRRALAISEQSYGTEHPEVAIRVNNLAWLLKETNRLAEAEPLMRRALAISEQSYGADHPKVAIRLNNLAQLLQDTNRLTEAEPMMRRALAIDEQFYGADHPEVAIDLNNLAQLLLATNRLAEAEPMMRRALDIFRASLGDEHPNTINVGRNYDLLLAAMAAGDPK